MPESLFWLREIASNIDVCIMLSLVILSYEIPWLFRTTVIHTWGPFMPSKLYLILTYFIWALRYSERIGSHFVEIKTRFVKRIR
jgi:hypothetical protein